MTDRGFYALDLGVTAGLIAAASLPFGIAWSALRVGGIDPVYVREAQFVAGLIALLVATVASRPTRPGGGNGRGSGDDDGGGPGDRNDADDPGSLDSRPTPDVSPILADVVPPARLRVGLYGALTGRAPAAGDPPGPAAHAFAATAVLFALSLGVELVV